jgi:hypothetical protein
MADRSAYIDDQAGDDDGVSDESGEDGADSEDGRFIKRPSEASSEGKEDSDDTDADDFRHGAMEWSPTAAQPSFPAVHITPASERNRATVIAAYAIPPTTV